MKRTASYIIALFLGLFVGWLGQQFWLSYYSLDNHTTHSQAISRQYQRLNDLKGQTLRLSQVNEKAVNKEPLSSKFHDALKQKNSEYALEQFFLLDPQALHDALSLSELLFEQERYDVLFSFLYDYRYGLDAKAEQELLRAIYQYVEMVDIKLGEAERYDQLVYLYRQLTSYQGDNTFYYLRLSYWLLQSGATYEASQSLLGAVNDISLVKEIQALQEAIALYEQVGPQIEIPLKVSGEHYLVSLALESGQSFELMIDTGASKTVLKRAFVEGMSGLLDDAYIVQMNTANGRAQGLQVKLNNLSIDKLQLADLDVVLMDLPKFKHDGLLGMNFLNQFDFKIDQENYVLRLTPKKIPISPYTDPDIYPLSSFKSK